MPGENTAEDAKWTKACFRVFGGSFEPDEITQKLGISPTNSGKKGQTRSSSRPRPPFKNSVWILNSPLADCQPLQDHLEWLLEHLEAKGRIIGELATQYDVEFFCGFSSENGQGQCIFDPGLLTRTGALGVTLVLDLYPPGPIALDSDQD